jgi:hypothetical protein
VGEGTLAGDGIDGIAGNVGVVSVLTACRDG